MMWLFIIWFYEDIARPGKSCKQCKRCLWTFYPIFRYFENILSQISCIFGSGWLEDGELNFIKEKGISETRFWSSRPRLKRSESQWWDRDWKGLSLRVETKTETTKILRLKQKLSRLLRIRPINLVWIETDI